jgi:hypothetical protein
VQNDDLGTRRHSRLGGEKRALPAVVVDGIHRLATIRKPQEPLVSA